MNVPGAVCLDYVITATPKLFRPTLPSQPFKVVQAFDT